jgi:hypothetical protein
MTSYLGVIRTVMLADTSQFNLAIRNASNEMRTSAMRMRTSAQSLVGIGAALNLGITIPALLAVRAVAKAGIEFDTNMMKIKNVTDMTSASFSDFKKAQRDLSFSIGVSQIELSKIGYLAGQAQLKSTAQLINFQKAVSMSQIVYPSDAKPEDVASGFISVINSFGVKEKDYERTMAEMIQTINLGTISWQEYSSTIQQVVALSSSFKSPTALKNLNIAAAIATQGGVRGPQVMTALRNVYTRIYKESGREGSGLNYVAQTKGFKNAADMFKAHDYDLLSYLKDATGQGLFATPEFLQAIKLGSREITTGAKLANADPAVVERTKRQYDRALSDFLEKYEEAVNSPINIMKRFGSAYSNLKLEFWSTMGPTILKITLSLTEFLKTLSRLPESAKKLLILGVALASFGSMLVLFAGMLKSAVMTLGIRKKIQEAALAGEGTVEAVSASRATRAALQEQILRARLARANALTEAVLARNAATAAKNTASAAKNMGKAAATAKTAAAAMTVAELIKAAKAAVGKTSPLRRGTAFDHSALVLRNPNMRGTRSTKYFRNMLGRFLPMPIGGRGVTQFPPAVRNSYTGFYPAAARASSGLMNIPTPSPSRHRNPSFAPYVGSTAMFSGTIPRFFERLGAALITFTANIGKWTVIALRFAGIAALIYTVFKGLWDALAVTLFPALESFGVKIEEVADVVGYLTKAIDLRAKAYAVLFVTLTHVIEGIFGLTFRLVESFSWLFNTLAQVSRGQLGAQANPLEAEKRAKWTKQGISKEKQDELLAKEKRLHPELNPWDQIKAIWKKGINPTTEQEKLEDLLNRFSKDTPPQLKNMYDAIDAKAKEDTIAVNNELATAPSSKFADFAEYGTQAGFNAIQEGRTGAAEEIMKLREQAAQQHIEQITAIAENAKTVVAKLNTTNDILDK